MGASPDAPASSLHTPVLYQEVLTALQPRAGGRYIDGTVGGGGHAAGLLTGSSPSGQVLGLDRDPDALRRSQVRLAAFGARFRPRHGTFARMAEIAGEEGWQRVDGVLLDLGLSSDQMADPRRGFSFREEGPLDMRFDTGQPTRAADLVNGLPVDELARLIAEYGEERRARSIARAIAARRPLETTVQLAEVVARAAAGARRGGVHPATRTFQALRIEVNDELETLKAGLSAALSILAPGGRLAVISFHSLEDRLVKQFLRRESRDCVCPPEQLRCTCGHKAQLSLVSRKPVRPGLDEVEANPRSRSARLRVAERIAVA